MVKEKRGIVGEEVLAPGASVAQVCACTESTRTRCFSGTVSTGPGTVGPDSGGVAFSRHHLGSRRRSA